MMIRTAVARSLALAVLSSFTMPAVVLLAPAAYAYDEEARYFEREEIEQLTAPIALYPDPLLAQILAAASYPDEIAAARRHVESRGNRDDIDRQNWEPSVHAVARYPEVLDFLARDLEWTEALGIANVNQPDDVADAIQRWRLQAYDLGSLRTNSQQIVYVDSGYVRIVPAQQDYFHVPRYDPEIIYVTRYVAGTAPFLLFGPRYIYGAWFDKDWDWQRRRIYYCNRDYWRNGRPVFHPQFDRVYVDRNRHWQPDRLRFKPPEKPSLPPRLMQTKIPSPPPEVKSGIRRDTHPPQAPTVRRGPGDEKKNAAPAGTAAPAKGTTPKEQPMHKRFSTGKQGQTPAPAKVEQPKPQPQAQPQPQQQKQQQQQKRREDELLQQQREPRR